MSFENDFLKRLDTAMKSLAERLEEQASKAQEQLLAQHRAFIEEMLGQQPVPLLFQRMLPSPPLVEKT